jgi:hypothetical protein
MSAFRIYRVLALGISLLLIISACGTPQVDESAMATAVAETVQAQNTQATVPVATSPAPTDTPSPLASMPATLTGTPLTQVAGGFCTPSASLVGETIPDLTIVQPGATFTKVWQLQNSGTCTWDTNWQLVYYSGDLMDGLTVYNLPEPAQPGDTLDIPIILRAPPENGSYTGEWMLKSPWGQTFGVGSYSVPISVSIVVGSGTPENRRTESVYGVTAVTYEINRRCTPANTFYEITAFITTNGPAEVRFTWQQSDGNREMNRRLTFLEATTHSYEWEWVQHSTSSSPNRRWVQIIVNEPIYQEFQQFQLPLLCGQQE